MEVIERGHIYKLDTKLGGEVLLTFFKDLPHSEESHDGVLCQEVLRALVDCVCELNRHMPCDENVRIIQNLRECIILFETRAYGRMLEKTYALTGKTIEQMPTERNGHIVDLTSYPKEDIPF